MAGRATHPLTPGSAPSGPRFLGHPVVVRGVAPSSLRGVDASADGAPPLHHSHLVLAYPAGLRPGLALERLALPPAHLLPRNSLAVLVSDCSALPRPATLVLVVAASRPPLGRRVEHRSVGPPDILAPCAVSVLCGDPTPRRPVRRGRPGGGGCPHVDSRVDRVPPAPVRDRNPAAVRPRR